MTRAVATRILACVSVVVAATRCSESSGDAYCWGSNSNGQLGDGTLTQRTIPVLVAGGLSFLHVSAGVSHTCGVTVSGVYCWGSNAFGQLGNGGASDSNVPVEVAGQ